MTKANPTPLLAQPLLGQLGLSRNYCVVEAPFGRLGISTDFVDGSLMVTGVEYLSKKAPLSAPTNALAKETVRQIKQYFKNPACTFDLPLKPFGTAHQQKVWHAVRQVAVGSTMTYGALAKQVKSGPRAVGGACGANPYPLIVPCHRIVSAQGVGGFMKENTVGFYREIKTWLLSHEGAV